MIADALYQVGDRWHHVRFGPGTVAAYDGKLVKMRYDTGEEVEHIDRQLFHHEGQTELSMTKLLWRCP